jgi:hypothetical protein|tara:strand:- start:87 stop:611 length:525 start_codon:yes stop_codon:yes gene_type:complete
VAQEFFINSQDLEDQIRKLLPSQGGAGAGFDLSASTQIIPIIDLTASAEGETLRSDLQRSVSFNDATVIAVNGSAQTVANTTGYWNIRGGLAMTNRSSGSQTFNIAITDGVSSKFIYAFNNPNYGSSNKICVDINLDIFLNTGDSCIVTAGVQTLFDGYIKQIASIDGTLTTPS